MSPHTSTFGRRAGLQGAAALGVGAFTAAVASAPAAAQGPAPGEITAGEEAAVAVSAATLWVEPDATRPGIDDPSLGNPVDLDAWNEAMEDTEIRRWLTGELETQAVLGSRVVVDEIRGDWAHVVVPAQPTPRDHRGYPGWVPCIQLVADRRYLRRQERFRSATVTALESRLHADPGCRREGIPVSFDTELPLLGDTRRSVQVAVPGQGVAYLPLEDVEVRDHRRPRPRPTADEVIATGEQFLGLRYLWAGVSSWGYDCSGFTYTMFRHHGVTIHRDAGPQRNNSGLAEVAREDLRRGDLVFFATSPGGSSIRHVAMYLGDDLILQAPNAARSVEIMSLTDYDADGEYAGARRYEYAA